MAEPRFLNAAEFRREPPERTFEIGLVLAGAISGGAYTAGVIDYLVEALADFERLRASGGPDAPRHRVVIRALAGASAGGITAALTATKFAARSSDVLRHTWVESIGIDDLLTSEDLRADAAVESLLDSTCLVRIMKTALDQRPADALPPFIAQPLDLFMSVSNLRGVPYLMEAGGGAAGRGHAMQRHADHLNFVLTDADTAPASNGIHPIPLARGQVGNSHESWQALGDGALATAAFPLGLKARSVPGRKANYENRLWPISRDEAPCTELARIRAREGHPEHCDFLAVDGGLMDNEPLELARRALAGPGNRNPRGPHKANRAVLLVDPFPEDLDASADTADPELFAVAARMFGALKNQARFKSEELALAQREDIYSRFLVSPVRTEADDRDTQPAICSAILGGFGGFLDRSFRAHDYALGRRNCQKFLRDHFELAADNPVFGIWEGPEDRRGDMRPILPHDLPEQRLPPRPDGGTVGREALGVAIDRRIRDVAARLIETKIGGPTGWAAKQAWSIFGQRKATDFVMARIEAELGRLV